MPDEEYQVARQARVRMPKVPSVRTRMELAIKWEKRLQAQTSLTRTALATEIGISPTRLTHILNLLNLAPKIRRHVLAMGATVKRSPITEHRLRLIARNRDHAFQLQAFAQLLSGRATAT